MSQWVSSTHHGLWFEIRLNRGEVHNAFDDVLIGQFVQALPRADASQSRAIVITAAGPSFSAGADMAWMQRMASASEADNYEDALKLAELMRRLRFTSKPTIARVHGGAFGGGVGLIACCDIAVGLPSAKFGLTETKLGLVPAVISPYVVEAIGARAARRLFLTAETFDAATAERYGLLHEICADEAALDARIQSLLTMIGKTGPIATREAKLLVGRISGRDEERQRELDESTATLIAKLRVSAEGQEGLGAFLNKRGADFVFPSRASTDSPARTP
jgi:methylglutaconyl-CoA hydratase